MFLFVVLFGGAATHTINLHLDLTQLDLTESKPYCTRSDLVKYRHLGLTVEEIVEVAMKLSSLKNLGISLTIEGIYVSNIKQTCTCKYNITVAGASVC